VGSSALSTPRPSSRDRKSARPPKRVPGGEIDEPVRARCDEPAPPELIRGIEQFNAGEFFDQHETLELLWRDTRTPVRGLYHGILQVGVGFHHWGNGNFHGASTLLEEGSVCAPSLRAVRALKWTRSSPTRPQRASGCSR
jgi:hypothetical protein